MKTVIDKSLYSSILEQWRGAQAKIWILDISLNRLGIRISRRDEPEVIYLVGVSCKHIIGPFYWENANLSIVVGSRDEYGESITRIVDENAGFELLCSGGVTIVQGPATDFDKTFDNFLGEDRTMEM